MPTLGGGGRAGMDICAAPVLGSLFAALKKFIIRSVSEYEITNANNDPTRIVRVLRVLHHDSPSIENWITLMIRNLV